MIIVFLHIFFYDIWYYISHIILHHPKIYYIHKIHHKTISPSLIIRSLERIFDTDNKNTKIYWRIIQWMLYKINIFIEFYTIKILIGKGILI